MNAPSLREYREAATPVPVRRQKRNPLRRHWLTGAFVLSLVGLVGYAGTYFYQAELRLNHARQIRIGLEEQIRVARLQNQTFHSRLTQVTSADNMELMAKSMGYVYPNETIYQKSFGKGE